jgi:hypothetical protein
MLRRRSDCTSREWLYSHRPPPLLWSERAGGYRRVNTPDFPIQPTESLPRRLNPTGQAVRLFGAICVVTTIVLLQVATMLCAVAVPFLISFRRARIVAAILWGWLLVFLWSFIWALLVPLALSSLDRALYYSIAEAFPEGPTVMAAAVGGWLAPATLVLFAWLLRTGLRRCWPAAFTRLCHERTVA